MSDWFSGTGLPAILMVAHRASDGTTGPALAVSSFCGLRSSTTDCVWVPEWLRGWKVPMLIGTTGQRPRVPMLQTIRSGSGLASRSPRGSKRLGQPPKTWTRWLRRGPFP